MAIRIVARSSRARPRPDGAPTRAPHHASGPHWEAWALRGVLILVLAYQALRGNRDGAVVAALGVALSLAPPLTTRLSGWHVPRLLDGIYAAAITLQFVSESFKLFELVTYWDKVVHPTEIALASAVATLLLLGYGEVHDLEEKVPDGLEAAGAMFFGMTLGGVWELIEFAFDWFGNANLQKSNADTMTDMFTNGVGAIFGTLAAFWLYRHRTNDAQRRKLGAIAAWLTDRLSRVLRRHGMAIGLVVALLSAAIVAAGWFVDRGPTSPPPAGQGGGGAWAFGAGQPGSSPTAVLAGDWHPATDGLCRVNAEQPHPGSEQPGLLALAPDASFDPAAGGFALSARARLERPALGDGTAMDAGLAFGVRDPKNYYLLKLSVLRDALILERYVDGRRRDMREERLRVRGDEWHDLRLEVQGGMVRAVVNGRAVFEEGGVEDAAGGLGLWARATRPACFAEARVAPVGG